MNRSVSRTLIIAALIFLGTILGPSAHAEDIKVGILLPLSGKLARFGEIERKSFLMAADKINVDGGINGQSIKLIIEDTRGKIHVGQTAIKKLIDQDKVCIIGGGFSSSVSWEAAKTARKNKVPFLVNTASADKITEKGGDYIFRLNPPVSEYPTPLNTFLTKVVHARTAAILYENTLFGQSEQKQFARQCQKWGLRVVTKIAYETEQGNFGKLLTAINGHRPDLFYIISSSLESDAAQIVRQAREMNLDVKLYVGGGVGFTLPEFQENAGIASDGVFAVTLWTPSVRYPGASDYYNEFVTRYNEPPDYHGAQAYAAMYVIADALIRAKSHTPHDVRDALAETDILTVFGPVKFISYGKKSLQNKVPTFLGQWVDGKFEAVWPTELTSISYTYPVHVLGVLNELSDPMDIRSSQFTP